MHQARVCCCSLHSKYTHTFFLILSSLKTWDLPFMMSFGCQNVKGTCFVSFEPLLTLRGTFFVVCLLLNTLALLLFAVSRVCISGNYVVALEPRKMSFVLSFYFFEHGFFRRLSSLLLLRFLSATYIHCCFFLCWQSSIKQF